MISRRTFLVSAGLAVPALAGGCRSGGAGSASARRLRVMLNGGIYEDLARRLVIAPFEKETGASVEIVPASSAQILTRLIAERAAPTVDVVIVDRLVMGPALEQGLFEKVGAANVPNMKDLAPEAVDPQGYGPVVHCHNMVIGYNTTRLDVDPPRSWAELWHPRFKGLVMPGAIELTPGLLFLLQANALNGGSYEDVGPGFEALKRLAPNVRKYFHNIGEVRPTLAAENVVVAIGSNMVQAEIEQGSPVARVFPAEGCPGSPAVAQIVRGTTAKDLAERFIDGYLRPEAQRGWASDYNVSVFNRRAGVPAEVTARIADKTVFFDAAAVSRGRAAWVDRWMREIRG
jgi:putative spermidine/putrescine transport system substrate-binding protein